MAVYVDPMRPCRSSRRWPWPEACHLTADSVSELDAFAGRLGLRPVWLQMGGPVPHYDLTRGKRAQAITAGALEETTRAFVARLRSTVDSRK